MPSASEARFRRAANALNVNTHKYSTKPRQMTGISVTRTYSLPGNTLARAQARLRQAVQTSGRRMMRLLNKTSENWEPEHKARATFKLSLRAARSLGELSYVLHNQDPIWNLLDRGTNVSYYINITKPAEFSTIPEHFISVPIPVQKYVWVGYAQHGIIPRGWRRMIYPIAQDDFEKEIRRALDDIVAKQLF